MSEFDRNDAEAGEGSPSPRDPRLEIPEVLRRPVRPPASAPDRGRGGGSGRGDWSDMAKAWGLAMEFVASILGGLLVGWLVDRWAGTAPAFTVVGLAAGFVLAFMRIVKQSAKGSKQGGRR